MRSVLGYKKQCTIALEARDGSESATAAFLALVWCTMICTTLHQALHSATPSNFSFLFSSLIDRPCRTCVHANHMFKKSVCLVLAIILIPSLSPSLARQMPCSSAPPAAPSPPSPTACVSRSATCPTAALTAGTAPAWTPSWDPGCAHAAAACCARTTDVSMESALWIENGGVCTGSIRGH